MGGGGEVEVMGGGQPSFLLLLPLAGLLARYLRPPLLTLTVDKQVQRCGASSPPPFPFPPPHPRLST